MTNATRQSKAIAELGAIQLAPAASKPSFAALEWAWRRAVKQAEYMGQTSDPLSVAAANEAREEAAYAWNELARHYPEYCARLSRRAAWRKERERLMPRPAGADAILEQPLTDFWPVVSNLRRAA